MNLYSKKPTNRPKLVFDDSVVQWYTASSPWIVMDKHNRVVVWINESQPYWRKYVIWLYWKCRMWFLR